MFLCVSPLVGFGRKAQVDSGLTWSSVFVCMGVGLFGGLVGYLVHMATPSLGVLAYSVPWVRICIEERAFGIIRHCKWG